MEIETDQVKPPFDQLDAMSEALGAMMVRTRRDTVDSSFVQVLHRAVAVLGTVPPGAFHDEFSAVCAAMTAHTAGTIEMGEFQRVLDHGTDVMFGWRNLRSNGG
jgi:hypothetical protein